METFWTKIPGLELPDEPTDAQVERSRRVPARIAVDVEGDGRFSSGSTIDVASGGLGAYLEADCPFQVGDSVWLDSPGVVNVSAKVVWRSDEGQTNHRGEACVSLGFAFDPGQKVGDLSRLITEYRPIVLIVDPDDDTRASIKEWLGTRYDVLDAGSADEALELFDKLEIAILILELVIPGLTGERFLTTLAQRFPNHRTVKIVLTGYADPETIYSLVDEHRLFYALQKPAEKNDLRALVSSGVSTYFKRVRKQGELWGRQEVSLAQRILEHARRLAIQRDAASVAQVTTEATYDLLSARRVYCHLYDPVRETLTVRQQDGSARESSAASGLTGFVARTGAVVNLPRAADARYIEEVDDPDGVGTEPFLAVPVLSPDGRVLAVLVAVRPSKEGYFSVDEEATLKALAGHASSAFSQAQLERVVVAGEERASTTAALFRDEAYEEYAAGDQRAGDVLRISPGWVSMTYWVIVALFSAAALFGIFGKVHDVTTGPAIVVAENRSTLTAASSGTVDAVHVKPGQLVTAGTRLVDLHAVTQEAELARIDKEFRIQLAKSLKDPSDEAARSALAGLRTQRDVARARLEERILRAPREGTVSDVRVRTGQVVEPGEALVTFVDSQSRLFVVALINGEKRPLIEPGMPLKLEFTGYRYAYQTVRVESVSDEILGPEEARGYLGTSLASSIELQQPVTVVRALLPNNRFIVRGEELRVHPGMLATAELRLRARRIVTLLVPSLAQ